MEGFDLGWLLAMSKNPVALGFLVFGLVQTVKRQAEAHKPPIVWNPWIWRGLAALIGFICAGLLHLWTGNATLGATGWAGVLVFGLVAAVCAVAGRDGVKTVLEWAGTGGAQVTRTTTQASTPDGATVATTTTTAPAGVIPTPAASTQDGPPPEAFEQAARPLGLLSAVPNGEPLHVTNPAYTLREE